MLVKSISLRSFPIGCLTWTACCDCVLSLVDIDFLVRVIHFGYFQIGTSKVKCKKGIQRG